MSTDQISRQPSSRWNGDAKLVSYDEYIDTQVENTRRLVKVVDLATSLVVLAAGVLAFLLAAAVVEHWLVPGGFPVVVRVLLFATLIGCVSYYGYRRLWPLAVRSINPVYAARAIEDAAATGPSLKNSLVNLLLFKHRRSEISDAVYQTLEEQAAQRLSRVPVDLAVDRSLLIRVGYVLVAIVAVASFYKVFSPKDPFVAAKRVLLPWANIVPASRVLIADVQPGEATISRGEFVDVSAEVRGIGEDDPVLLRFTTADGRAVNKSVMMKLSKDGLRFEGRLPEGGEGKAGLAQNVRYRIEAGDARSLDYDVTVVSAPSILVERVEYDFPDYTAYTDRQVEGLGDIRAIEGTRVTIHAKANGTIQQAHVDFDSDGRRDLDMLTKETKAAASFELRLREDRQTPRHASYVLRFTNTEGRTNHDPVKYAIHVEADLAPEARILLPEEKELLIQLDETVTIEAEAIDPDFALSDVRLHGEVAGQEVVNVSLFKNVQGKRYTGRYEFAPSAHGLRAGDAMQYWVTANDNRTPQPNTASSERNLLRIASSDPAQQPPADRLAQRDRQPRGPQGAQGEQQQQGGQPQDSNSQDGQRGERQQRDMAGSDGQRGNQQQQGRREEGGQAGGQSGEPENQNQDGEQGAQGAQPQGGGQNGSEAASQAESQNDETANARAGEPQGQEQGRETQSGKQSAGDKQTGAGTAGGEPSGAQPDGARPDRKSNGGSTEGHRRESGGQDSSDEERSPVSAEGDNDAEAFDRIRRHLERGGELPEQDAGSREEDAAEDGRAGQRVGEQRQQREEAEPQGDEEQGKGASENESAFDRLERSDESAGDQGGGGEDATGNKEKPSGTTPRERSDENDTPVGGENSSDGPSGAGEEQEPQGSPNAQPGMKPGEKRQESPTSPDRSDSGEPPAGSRGKNESDSQGEQGGDRPGGGEEGGGQDAPRDGTGGAGQHQSADEGAGQSTEQGTGTETQNGGEESPADRQTGRPGDERGQGGSERREGEGQEAGGNAEDTAESGQRGEADKQAGKRGGRPGDQEAEQTANDDAAARSPQDAGESMNQEGTATGGGGESGTASGRPQSVEGTAPEGDEANLEYARKQTDLVLERLAEQLKHKRIDDRLLDELGWSEDDLRRFVERWQARKEAAQRGDRAGSAARRELDDALRSLGLQRGPLQQSRLEQDSMRDLREGYRGAVPLEYQERLRAYNEGVSRGQRDSQ